MKYVLFLLTSCLIVQSAALAQQAPFIRLTRPGLYSYNQLYLNPAYAGYQGKTEFGFSAMRVAMPGNKQPLLGIGYYHSAIDDHKSNVGAVISYEDQDNAYWKGKFGLIFTRRYNLGEYTHLAIGAQLSGKYLNVNLTEYTGGAFANDDNDLRPDVDAGIWFSRKEFYLGISGVSLLQPTFELQGQASRKEQRELFATTGYKFIFGRDLHVTPSVLLNKPVAGGKVNVDFSTQATLKLLVIRATYRGQYNTYAPWLLQAGLQVKDKVQLVLATGIAGSDDRDTNSSTLEGNLNFRF